jgi:hypothetical protein
MVLFKVLAGIGLLLMGRRLFWLFVGLIGFVSGLRIGAHFFPGQPEWMILVMGLVAGVLGALFAVFLQWGAILSAGFITGAYVAVRLLHVGVGTSGTDWIVFLIGGILGGLVMVVLFDWALIVLSSLAGAGLITEVVRLDRPMVTVLFTILSIFGVIIQFRLVKMKRSSGR